MTATIPVGKGHVALIDEADAFLVNLWRWQAKRVGRNSDGSERLYVSREERHNGKVRRIYLHRFLLGVLPGEEVDHVDGDSLNNQRGNLRKATSFQQKANLGKRLGETTSRYKGVHYDRRRNCWRAEANANGKRLRFGPFSTEEEAAAAYDTAAIGLFGEFARLNFPPRT